MATKKGITIGKNLVKTDVQGLRTEILDRTLEVFEATSLPQIVVAHWLSVAKSEAASMMIFT